MPRLKTQEVDDRRGGASMEDYFNAPGPDGESTGILFFL
jgi:hypothetical protein